MLAPFATDIWTSDGPNVTGALGFHFPTRMAVLKLADGDLFVWSPVAITDGLRANVDGLGRVAHLVAPNSLHHVSLGAWKTAYPDAMVHGAPGLHAVRRDIAFAAELGDAPHPAWVADIDQVVVRGNRITTEVVIFHQPSRTAIFTDLIQQYPKGWFRGWRGIVAKLDGMTGPEPAVPQKFRTAFADRAAARAALRRILAWPTERVLMAHGPPVTTHGAAFLARAFAWLKP